LLEPLPSACDVFTGQRLSVAKAISGTLQPGAQFDRPVQQPVVDICPVPASLVDQHNFAVGGYIQFGMLARDGVVIGH